MNSKKGSEHCATVLTMAQMVMMIHCQNYIFKTLLKSMYESLSQVLKTSTPIILQTNEEKIFLFPFYK